MLRTITVTDLPELNAVQMSWAHRINGSDVMFAFKQVNDLLNKTNARKCVIVDLRENPNFPLTDTLRGALGGTFQNPRLSCWMVIGANPMARSIGRILSSVTSRDNIKWFDTLEQVTTVIQRSMQSQVE